MERRAEAIKLLKESAYFSEASDGLLQALADIMVPIEAEDGHIFLEEGEEIHFVMVLEQGKIQRTKLSAVASDFAQMQSSLRSMPKHRRSVSIGVTSVVVDTIQGRGRITGLLHNFKPGSKAFATVLASGPTKVWLMDGERFREIISETPDFSLNVMYALARELRLGSKSLRSLIKKAKTGGSESGDVGQNVCKVLCYDATSWVTDGFKPAVKVFNEKHAALDDQGHQIEMDFTTERLSEQSATYAAGYDAVCLFVNDNASANALQTLSLLGVRMVAMRCAGFDRVDLKAARAFGFTLARVPAYSPYAVAEMAVSLLMAVNRKINKASNRVKMANFTLDTGLMGMDIFNKSVGVMGTGKIGQLLCNIMLGFGANLLCYDVFENEEIKAKGGIYVSQDEIMAQSDILFLMMPLLPATKHTINDESVRKLKRGVILINTSRGGLIDTKALLKGLSSGRISGVGLDVYENESDYFFQDWSARNIPDPDLVALLGNNNVVLTAHQAFFTKEAVNKIVSTTLENIHDFQNGLIGPAHPNNCIPPS